MVELKLPIHPLLYAQQYRLNPIEACIIHYIVQFDKTGRASYLGSAYEWLTRLILYAYAGGKEPHLHWATGGPPLEELAGVSNAFCDANGLSDDAWAIIACLTMHRSDSENGYEMLSVAHSILSRMLPDAGS